MSDSKPLHEYTDFPASFARVVEGFCPLCGQPIKVREEEQTIVSDETQESVTAVFGRCTFDNVGFHASNATGRPVVWTSRPLTRSERDMLLGVEG